MRLNFNDINAYVSLARKAAKARPGRYGGAYIGQKYDKRLGERVLILLDDDDPETVPTDIDVLLHVTPTKVFPIGRAGSVYLRAVTV